MRIKKGLVFKICFEISALTAATTGSKRLGNDAEQRTEKNITEHFPLGHSAKYTDMIMS